MRGAVSIATALGLSALFLTAGARAADTDVGDVFRRLEGDPVGDLAGRAEAPERIDGAKEEAESTAGNPHERGPTPTPPTPDALGAPTSGGLPEAGPAPDAWETARDVSAPSPWDAPPLAAPPPPRLEGLASTAGDAHGETTPRQRAAPSEAVPSFAWEDDPSVGRTGSLLRQRGEFPRAPAAFRHSEATARPPGDVAPPPVFPAGDPLGVQPPVGARASNGGLFPTGGERPGAVLMWTLFLAAVAPSLLLALYRRIEPSRALESERRAAVHALVTGRPGATAGDVARALGLHYNTARHHLRFLTRARFIAERDVGGRLAYFENHGRYSPEEARRLALGAREASAAVLRLAAEMPGISQGEVAVRLGLAKSTVSERVGLLRGAGLLGGAPGAGLRLTPEGAMTLAGVAGPRS